MSGSRRESRARQTLEEFYEQLDRKWREAEDLLLSLRVPAPVTQTIRTAEPEFPRASRYRHKLGFLKHYGRWGLCYGVCAEDDPQDQYWTSIHRCSIEQRVQAAQAFPALRDQMLQAAERYTDTVAQALSLLSGSLAPEVEEPASSDLSQGDELAETRQEESVDLLADEQRPPESLPECETPEDPLEAPMQAVANAPGEPVISGEAEILRPIEPGRSLILWTSPGCLFAADREAPADPADDPPSHDAPPVIIAPFSLERWESEGGEIAREAA
jgi:hypothetical protein